jgi:predicted HNH restriction endonuclease
MKIPTQSQYERILREGLLSQPQLDAIYALYYLRKDHSAFAHEIAEELGYKDRGGVNLRVGLAGKCIGQELGITPAKRPNGSPYWYMLIAGGERVSGFFLWTMHKSLARALEKVYGLSEEDVVDLHHDEKLAPNQEHHEGGRIRVEVNRYERSRKAREACLAAHGAVCKACGFDFEATYGEIGEGFIHVHHKRSVSDGRRRSKVNPKTDLVPVCPNCHAMLHRQEPPLSIEKLRKRLRDTKKGKKGNPK